MVAKGKIHAVDVRDVRLMLTHSALHRCAGLGIQGQEKKGLKLRNLFIATREPRVPSFTVWPETLPNRKINRFVKPRRKAHVLLKLTWMHGPEMTGNAICKYFLVIDPGFECLTLLHLLANLVQNASASAGIKTEENHFWLAEPEI
jgi:hypothetical protein